MRLMPVILASWEGEIKRIVVGGQPRRKVNETPSQPIKSWVWWCTPVTPGMQEV
jgi:hypothetical protein